MERERQRRRARKWAAGVLVPLGVLGAVYVRHSGNPYAMAEELGVTQVFLDEVVGLYTAVYGVQTEAEGYTFRFIPYFEVKRAGDAWDDWERLRSDTSE